MKLKIFLISVSIFLRFHLALADCPNPDKTETVLDSSLRTHAILTWNSDSILSAPTPKPTPEGIRIFREWVQKYVNPDLYELLERKMNLAPSMRVQNEYFIKSFGANFYPMGCLETQLFAMHDGKFSNKDIVEDRHLLTGAEFEAYVFENRAGTSSNVKVIFVSAFESKSTGSGPSNFPDSKQFIENQIPLLIRSGYKLTAQLHNHPFAFHNPTGDIAGIIIPSGCSTYGDISTFIRYNRDYSLSEAWITNGFDTVKMNLNSAEFAAYVKLVDQVQHCDP